MDKQSKHGLKTFIPNLMKFNPTKSNINSPNDTFLTKDVLEKYCSVFSTEKNTLPHYMVKNKELLDELTTFSDEFWETTNKIQMDREWKMREGEVEEAMKEAAEQKIGQVLDLQVTKILNANQFFYKRICPVKIPYKSCLSHEEHALYLRAFIKFQIRPPKTKNENAEYDYYLRLQHQVYEEQTYLMSFSYDVARLQLEESNKVPAIMEKYVRTHVEHRCERVQNYPKMFHLEAKIPIKPPVNTKNDLEGLQLEHKGHLLSLGSLPWIYLPNGHYRINLPIDASVTKSQNPDGDQDFDSNKYLYKTPVSEDPNAEYLANQHKVSIVLSASTFKTLANNQYSFDTDWNIPIRIKTHTSKDKSGNEVCHRIVYMDKPFVRKAWHPLQKKVTFYKKAALTALAKFVDERCFRLTPSFRHRSSVDDIFETPPQEFEEFGQDYAPVARKRSASYRDKSPIGTETDESDGNLRKSKRIRFEKLIDLDDPSSQDDSFIMETDSPSCSEPSSSIEGNKTNENIPTSATHTQLCDNKTSILKSESGLLDNLLSDQNTLLTPQQTGPVTPVMSRTPKGSKVKTEAATSFTAKNASKNNPITTCKISCDTKTRVTSLNQSSESGGLLDNLLSEQSTLLKPQKTDPVTQKHQITSNIGSYFDKTSPKKVAKPWDKTRKTKWKDFQVKECPPHSGNNVHYQLFSFKNSSTTDDPIPLLIRHKVHGLSRYSKVKRSSEAYVVYPKIENQAYFGCEVSSLSEITEQWAILAVRPHTTILHLRVCVESGTLIISEERDMQTVLKDGKQAHIKFDPQAVLTSLYITFQMLLKMPSGDYLLHHSSKTEAFIELFSAVEADTSMHRASYDLHAAYSDGKLVSRVYTAAQWLPIDTHVLTPFHLRHKKIPATFPMENPNQQLSKKEKKLKRETANKKKSIDDLKQAEDKV